MLRRMVFIIVACLMLAQLPALVRYVAAVAGVAHEAAALQVAVDDRERRMQRAMDEAR